MKKPYLRKVCVVSSSRADYGLLRSTMQIIQEDPKLKLQIIAKVINAIGTVNDKTFS